MAGGSTKLETGKLEPCTTTIEPEKKLVCKHPHRRCAPHDPNPENTKTLACLASDLSQIDDNKW